ncbi:LCP family protein [Rothia sp. LK2588]|uniref:LCP family protein n=1 Tax=Rothia sp. LK2588 TaxID=3114369 RepID=UPI0034CD2B2A
MAVAPESNRPPRRKKKGLIVLGVILGLILALGIGGCAYVASIGKAWDDGTDKFQSQVFPNEDGTLSDPNNANDGKNANGDNGEDANGKNKDVPAALQNGEITKDKGEKKVTPEDQNGNGIPDKVENGKVTKRPEETGSTDILLLGSDSRAGSAEAVNVQGQRADSIMILHIPNNGGDPYLISVMRDTWVNIPGHGSAKVNHGLDYGGVGLQVSTLEQLLNVRIDHVAEIDFTGFKSMTDALGGVDVNVPISFKSDHYEYTQGQMHMDGAQALEFVRQRYAFEDGDYQRVRNQRAFMDGVLHTIQSKGAFNNATNFKNVVESIAPYVTVDSGLDSGEMAQLATPYIAKGGAHLHKLTLPNAGTGWSADGQSIVILDSEATSQLSDALRNNTMSDYTAKYGED